MFSNLQKNNFIRKTIIKIIKFSEMFANILVLIYHKRVYVVVQSKKQDLTEQNKQTTNKNSQH